MQVRVGWKHPMQEKDMNDLLSHLLDRLAAEAECTLVVYQGPRCRHGTIAGAGARSVRSIWLAPSHRKGSATNAHRRIQHQQPMPEGPWLRVGERV